MPLLQIHRPNARRPIIRKRKTSTPSLNPMQVDPTRTTMLRKRFGRRVSGLFDRLKLALTDLIVRDNGFGLTANQSFAFHTDAEKLDAFRKWLQSQYDTLLLNSTEEELWTRYVEEGFMKGAGRAFDDVAVDQGTQIAQSEIGSTALTKSDFYAGARAQFLRTAFGQAVATEKVKLLAARTFTDVRGMTEDLATKLTRILTDGLVQGLSPREVARTVATQIDISRDRALTIARTELIRAHAEGQLTAMEELGVEEVGAQIEWLTARDRRVCPLCKNLAGMRFKIDEARGMLPRHPNCRCAWRPVMYASTKQTDLAANRSFFASCARDPKGRCLPGSGGVGARAIDKLLAFGAMASHVEHLAKDYVTDGIASAVGKLPPTMQGIVHKIYALGRAGTNAAFASYTVGQMLAERVAKERGATPEQAKRLRGILSSLDITLLKPVQIGLAATGAGAAILGGASFAPVATTGYLAYSTARDPLATARAAYGLVKDYAISAKQGMKKVAGKFRMTRNEANAFEDLLDALKDYGYDDWFIALLSTALDEEQDLGEALMTAEALYLTVPRPSAEVHNYAVMGISLNSFCKTGKGGGKDPTCSPNKGKSRTPLSKDQAPNKGTAGSKGSPPAPEKKTSKMDEKIPKEFKASKKVWDEAKALAAKKIEEAPIPTPEQVDKAREELRKAAAGEGRAGGDSRGGSSADRRKQRENLFKEFGGEERGYVVCHGTGIKLHYSADPELNPHGYPLLERGKIFTKFQGGGYQLPNLLPESFQHNRSRNDKTVRTENLE